MSDAQRRQLDQIMAVAEIKQLVFDSSTQWEFMRVSYVIDGVWFTESIHPDGSASDRTIVAEEGRA